MKKVIVAGLSIMMLMSGCERIKTEYETVKNVEYTDHLKGNLETLIEFKKDSGDTFVLGQGVYADILFVKGQKYDITYVKKAGNGLKQEGWIEDIKLK